jgi:hypothetical protein
MYSYSSGTGRANPLRVALAMKFEVTPLPTTTLTSAVVTYLDSRVRTK